MMNYLDNYVYVRTIFALLLKRDFTIILLSLRGLEETQILILRLRGNEKFFLYLN